MANKQIIDYAAGSFANNNQFLLQPNAGGIYQKATLSAILGFKMYFARVIQENTDDPVEVVTYNNLGFAPVWSRVGVGDCRLSSAGNFPANKTFVLTNALGGIDIDQGCTSAFPDISGDFIELFAGSYLNQANEDNFDMFILILILP